MRYPYERFLRFLVSRKVDVNSALKRLGLPAVGGLWVADCRTSFREGAPPAVIAYLDGQDVPVPDEMVPWARREGFAELWQARGGADADLDAAIQLFSSVRSRSRMALLLAAKADDAGLLAAAPGFVGSNISQRTLDLYRRLFWDGQLLSRSHWDRLLDALETKEERHHVALGLEAPTLAKLELLLQGKVGLEPDEVLRRVMATSLEQYENALRQPLPGLDAIKWGEMAKNAAVALAQHAPKKTTETNAPSDFSGLFTVQVTKSRHVTLADLQGEDDGD